MSGALSNIYDNISFALRLHSEAMTRLQEQVSTGSRLNRASDDPSAAYRVLGLNSQKRSLENYIDNASEVLDRLEITSTILQEMVSGLVEAKKSLTQIASGIYNQESRDRIAQAINDTLEQMVSLANTKHANQHLFGGSKAASAAYIVERTDGEITRVIYQGGSEGRNVEVAPGLQSSAFCVGDAVFCSSSRSAPIFMGDTGAQAGTGTPSVRGDVWLTVTGSDGNYDLSIDDGLSIFHTNGADDNLAVTDSRTGQILYVDCSEISSAGVELVSVPGTYDVFNTLISIRDALRNERGLSEAQLQELLNNSLGSLDEIRNLLVQTEVSVGLRIGFLSDLKDSLKNRVYNTEDETTRLQEADIAQVAIDLSRREVLYQMSLSVAGKLMSMSLLDFIR